MKCVVIDYDDEVINLIESFIGKVPFLELVNSFKCSVTAVNFLKENEIDVVFTEVDMPNFSGIDIVKSSVNKETSFVFITAYAHFAVEAYNIGVIDYLVKPLNFHRFFKAISKLKFSFDLKEKAKGIEEVSSKKQNFIFVKSEYENIKVNLDEIKYLESLKDYVKIHIVNGKSILTLGSLKKFEEKLKGSVFVRVHKSYIVSINHIYSIQRNRIVIDDVRVPIGLNYKDKFLEEIGN